MGTEYRAATSAAVGDGCSSRSLLCVDLSLIHDVATDFPSPDPATDGCSRTPAGGAGAAGGIPDIFSQSFSDVGDDGMRLPARSRGRVVGILLCENRLVENAGTFDPGMRLEMSSAASPALHGFDFSAPLAPGGCFALFDTDEQQKAMRMRVTFSAVNLCRASCVCMLYSNDSRQLIPEILFLFQFFKQYKRSKITVRDFFKVQLIEKQVCHDPT